MIHRRTALFTLAFALSVAGCGRETPPPKVLVIGLDGATWDLLTPWIDAGELPRLRSLRDGGVWGTLLSVVPPFSPPAWTSATTGVNPGVHGIFDFYRLDPDSMIAYSETAASRRVPAVWTLLSENGKKVGVLNIPMTDPPDPVNGFHVAGMPHPDSLGFAYPPELEEQLHRQGYRLDRMGEFLEEGHEDDLKDEIFDTFRRRRREALALGEAHPDLDLYWVVFTGTDRVQHFFWKFMEEDHPYYDPELAGRYGDTILEFYREADAAIGDLIDQAGAQAAGQGRELAVIVLSDHGFYGVQRAFRPQSFLRNPPDGKPPITIAYSLEDNASLLYVPQKGRERGATLTPEEQDEVVDDILARILEVRDPESGESPVLLGARREDLYRGRYVDKAPDLVFIPRRPYYFIGEEGDKDPFGTPAFSFSGHHDPRGIIIAWGKMFGRGKLEGRLSLLDVSPTLMYLAGETVAGYMEGEVRVELFTEEALRRNPVRRDESEARPAGSDDLERLEAIPYLQ
jgi:predicted AlkP superfamily phosphohydrolase/phosphomutase